MKNWLNRKTVILTGASGGIGRALTKRLIVKYGANVIGIGRSESKMLSLSQELGERASAFSYRIFDVSDKDAWKTFSKELTKNGTPVHVLINNAGVFPSFLRAEATETDVFERVLKTNYMATVYAVNAISPILQGTKKHTPAIVNICSSAALCSVVGTSAYSASKAALKGYTEVLQMEERGEKYVGIFYPGTTSTELFRNDENTKNSALDLIAMPADRMAKKLARKLAKKRKRAVVGWDAKLMNLTAKLFPVAGLRLIAGVMRISKSKVFSNVFDNKNKE